MSQKLLLLLLFWVLNNDDNGLRVLEPYLFIWINILDAPCLDWLLVKNEIVVMLNLLVGD